MTQFVSEGGKRQILPSVVQSIVGLITFYSVNISVAKGMKTSTLNVQSIQKLPNGIESVHKVVTTTGNDDFVLSDIHSQVNLTFIGVQRD